MYTIPGFPTVILAEDMGQVTIRPLEPSDEQNCKYDVNCDGLIDPLDSGFVLARFGQCDEP